MYLVLTSKSVTKFLVLFIAIHIVTFTSFGTGKNDKESLFKVIKPRELTSEEKAMKFEERFSKHYIGGIPSSLDGIVKYMAKYDIFSKTDLKIPNKILLYGNPGNGKTYLPEMLSEQLQLPLISVDAASLQSKYYSEISKNVHDLIDFAKTQNNPTILLIDEVDNIARDPSDDKNETDRNVIHALLTALQKLDNNKNIFVFVTLSQINILDETLRDRFVTCEMKDFSLVQRTQLIMKKFKENGSPVEEAFAKRVAEVISIKELNFEFKPTLEIETPIVNRIINKVSPLRYHVSNRDIERVIFNAVMAQRVDCKESNNCNKSMCYYVREALDKLGFIGVNYAEKPTYCCGI